MNDPIWGQLLLQLVLILTNAFFAATEIAVISLNENIIRSRAEEGDKIAGRLLKMLTDSSSFLSTIQIGITIAGFLGAAFASENFSSRLMRWLYDDLNFHLISENVLNTICVVLITILLSYFTLVMGELVPKKIAMRSPEKVAKATCGVVSFLSKVFRPVIWFLAKSTNGVLRLLGINPKDEANTVSEEEIQLLVELGEESGSINANDSEMIKNIFDFKDLTAEEIMVHRTEMMVINLDDSPEEILRKIVESGYSRFPVCGDNADDVRGIIRAREFLLSTRNGGSVSLEGLLTKAYFVPETVRADVLFRDMQANKVHIAIVIDEYGGTSGLCTMEDLLEVIVGDIYDESDDVEEAPVVKIGDNLWRADGGASLGELSEALEIELDDGEEEYETLGGLVFSKLSSIPPDGAAPEIETSGLKIKVEEISDRRVVTALISKAEEKDE